MLHNISITGTVSIVNDLTGLSRMEEGCLK